MTNRIFSEAYDTALQKDYFEKKHKGIAESFVDERSSKKSFVDELSSKLKSDIVFYGKIVLTDAQFYDSPLLHMMSDDELSAFRGFLGESAGAVEVRCRPHTLPRMLGKQFLYSSVRHAGLSTALYEIGATLSENDGRVKENSAAALVSALKEHNDGRLCGLESEFEEFASRLCQLDEFRTKIGGFFVEWGTSVDERMNARQDFKDLPAVMAAKREFLINELTSVSAKLKDANVEAIKAELNKDYPIAAVIKVYSSAAPEFFRTFRRWYNIGLASQHFADSPCVFDYDGENADLRDTSDPAFAITVDGSKYEELFKSTWNDFTSFLEDIATARDYAWGAYESKEGADYSAAIGKISEYVSDRMPLVLEVQELNAMLAKSGINSVTTGISTERTTATVFNDIQKTDSCSVVYPKIQNER
jgi:hypothetical protein